MKLLVAQSRIGPDPEIGSGCGNSARQSWAGLVEPGNEMNRPSLLGKIFAKPNKGRSPERRLALTCSRLSARNSPGAIIMEPLAKTA